MGDVKLAGVMGLYLGLSVIPALLIAFLPGTVVGRRASWPARARGARKKGVPFGPFLALGGIVGRARRARADRALRGQLPL